MAIGLIAKKVGMTQWIMPDGQFVPVSCLEAGPCVVLAIKEKTVVLGFENLKENKVKKPQLDFFKKINVTPKYRIREILKTAQEYQVGQEIKADIFQEGDFVDVSGVSIGKGFQGGMKRWNWRGGPRSHGSTSHRRIGSVGSNTFPGRVFRGHHMPGHLGNRTVNVQNLKVIKVDAGNNLILVKGAVPGPKNNIIIIRKAKKKKHTTAAAK